MRLRHCWSCHSARLTAPERALPAPSETGRPPRVCAALHGCALTGAGTAAHMALQIVISIQVVRKSHLRVVQQQHTYNYSAWMQHQKLQSKRSQGHGRTLRVLMSLFSASALARCCRRLRIQWYCLALTYTGSSSMISVGSANRGWAPPKGGTAAACTAHQALVLRANTDVKTYSTQVNTRTDSDDV